MSMMDSQHFINNLWRWKCGLPELTPTEEHIELTDLEHTEWSPEFERLMRNRLVFGAIRYGRMGHGELPPGKPVYDRCESIRRRLERWERSGNAEWLVDIANMALLMYEERMHPDWHFRAVDGDDTDSYHDNILEGKYNIEQKDEH